MYTPNHFSETSNARLRELVRDYPLGTFVVHTPNGLLINHIPFIADADEGTITTLRAHVPRANPVANALSHDSDTAENCVVIFQGASGYISPSWYATKAQHGKVVPTWNYAVVHVHGKVILHNDEKWIRTQLEDLTSQQEAHRTSPWAVTDAPESYTSKLLAALVGIEVQVTRVDGKTKAGQNQPQENQLSMLEALGEEAPGSDLEKLMQHALKENS